MGDDSIDAVILDIDVGYLVTLPAARTAAGSPRTWAPPSASRPESRGTSTPSLRAPLLTRASLSAQLKPSFHSTLWMCHCSILAVGTQVTSVSVRPGLERRRETFGEVFWFNLSEHVRHVEQLGGHEVAQDPRHLARLGVAAQVEFESNI